MADAPELTRVSRWPVPAAVQTFSRGTWIGVALCLLAVALAIADKALDFGTFWQPLPMLTQLVGGLLLLGVTVFAVDTVVRRRADDAHDTELAARWQGLGGIPFRSLANGLGDVIDATAWLLTAEHPLDRPPFEQCRLEHLLSAAGTGPTRTGDTGALTSETLASQLRSLSAEPAWCRFAHDHIDRHKWAFRDRVGTWAASMLSLDELAAILSRMSVVDDAVSELQAPLRRLAHLGQEQPDADTGEELVRAWFAFLHEAMSMREELQWAAYAARGHGRAPTRSAVAPWRKFRGWLLEDDRRLVALRLVCVGAGSSARWHTRLQGLLSTPLRDTETLLAYWQQMDVYWALPKRRRWRYARPRLERGPSP